MPGRRNEDLDNMVYMKTLQAFMKDEEEASSDLIKLLGLRDTAVPEGISYMHAYFKQHLFVFRPELLVRLYEEHENWRRLHTDVNVTNVAQLVSLRFLAYYSILEEEGAVHGAEETE
ncbi:MAG: hypothetical protein K5930_11355 [Treponemataceae bacterium]|nr:hypothetical protein [Treponemataceae bacterium]